MEIFSLRILSSQLQQSKDFSYSKDSITKTLKVTALGERGMYVFYTPPFQIKEISPYQSIIKRKSPFMELTSSRDYSYAAIQLYRNHFYQAKVREGDIIKVKASIKKEEPNYTVLFKVSLL